MCRYATDKTQNGLHNFKLIIIIVLIYVELVRPASTMLNEVLCHLWNDILFFWLFAVVVAVVQSFVCCCRCYSYFILIGHTDAHCQCWGTRGHIHRNEFYALVCSYEY